MKTKITIIDSGISSKHFAEQKNISGMQITKGADGSFSYQKDCFEDTIGHGTAVTDAILKTFSDTDIFMIKIFGTLMEAEEDLLQEALRYVAEHVDTDILHISAGLTTLEDSAYMEQSLQKIAEKNCLIVAAFDNYGSVSYPAIYKQVIGVDSCESSSEKDYIIINKNSDVDITIPDRYQRLKWVTPPEIIIRGSSFTSGIVTGRIAAILSAVQRRLKKAELLEILERAPGVITKEYPAPGQYHWVKGREFVNKIERAIVFPFNKEIHPLLMNEKNLSFQLVGCYDSKYSGRVGKEVCDILKHADCCSKLTVKEYETIDWENGDFDCVICGHCGELSEAVGKNYLEEILKKAKKNGKKVYSFDSINQYMQQSPESDFFFPQITREDIPAGRNGKLRERTVPVLGVFGTSSAQGKLTLQLELKKRLVNAGYQVRHICTEPNGYLLGADGVFPMGYHSTVEVQREESVQVLNEMLWDVTTHDQDDLVITGGQSGTVIYEYGNLRRYNFPQYEFLCAMTPDVIVLCINPHDTVEYIQRSMALLNSLGDTVIIGCVLFPIKQQATKLGYGVSRKELTKDELDDLKLSLEGQLETKVYALNEDADLDMLTERILSELLGGA